jgi:hypothetical protein
LHQKVKLALIEFPEVKDATEEKEGFFAFLAYIPSISRRQF